MGHGYGLQRPMETDVCVGVCLRKGGPSAPRGTEHGELLFHSALTLLLLHFTSFWDINRHDFVEPPQDRCKTGNIKCSYRNDFCLLQTSLTHLTRIPNSSFGVAVGVITCAVTSELFNLWRTETVPCSP